MNSRPTEPLMDFLSFPWQKTQGHYELIAYFNNRRAPLGTRFIQLHELPLLLDYLEAHGHMMNFDDYPARVSKVEINLEKNVVILKAKTSET